MQCDYTTLLFLFICVACDASTITWNSTSSGNWHNPAHWNLGRVPIEADDVEITVPGNYTVLLTIGPSIKVKSLKIGGAYGLQLLDVYLPFVVQEQSIILSNGIVQFGSSLHGLGSLTVHGKLKLCGSFHSLVNISDVDILEGGIFEVWYKQHENSQDCIDFFDGTSNNVRISPLLVLEDDVFGIPLANGEISIIVPSTRNGNIALTEVEHQFYVQLIARQLSILAGGATATPGYGFWVSDYSHQLIREKVTIITVAADISVPLKKQVKHIARWLARDLQQEAVFVQVNKQSFLVRVYA